MLIILILVLLEYPGVAVGLHRCGLAPFQRRGRGTKSRSAHCHVVEHTSYGQMLHISSEFRDVVFEDVVFYDNSDGLIL